MLNRAADHSPAARRGRGGDAANREVVGLGRARREIEILGTGADEGADLPAGLVDRPGRLPARRVVHRVRVGELLVEERQHRLEHPGVDRGGRLVVQIDRQGRGFELVCGAAIDAHRAPGTIVCTSPTLSARATARALMFTNPRTVVEGVTICAERSAPTRIGPMDTPPPSILIML